MANRAFYRNLTPINGSLVVRINRTLQFGVLVLAASQFSEVVRAETSTEAAPTELRPYRIQVVIAYANDPLLNTSLRENIRKEIEELLRISYGEMWRPTEGASTFVTGNSSLPFSNKKTLVRLSENDLNRYAQKAGADKCFLLTLARTGTTYQLAGREWDGISTDLSPLRSSETQNRAEISREFSLLIAELFRPVATIEEAERGQVRLVIQAGELTPQNSNAGALLPGDLLQPVIRYYDRDRNLKRIEFIPWTYLQVESSRRAITTCRLQTGLNSPLGNARRRVEAYALLAKPTTSTTRLKLVAGEKNPAAQVGVEVSVEPSAPVKQDAEVKKEQEESSEKPAPMRFVSDRWGTVTIPAAGPSKLLWVSVHSGTVRLARVPFLAGHFAEATLLLPDDSERLKVEGQLSQLQTELIQTVARRGVLLVQVRLFGKQGKIGEARQALAKLKKLPPADDYLDRVTAIRYSAVELAKNKGNRIGALRIEKLCKATSELIASYLDDTKLVDAQNELAEYEKIRAEAGE